MKGINRSNSKHFLLADFLSKNEVFHIARVSISSKLDLSLHSHDYAELLWIEKGSGVHHINGKKISIKEGDMIMIRPSDTHTFSSHEKDLTLVNIAFSKECLDHLKNRYFPEHQLFFWTEHHLPSHMTLSKDILRRISSRAEESMKHKRTYLQLDSLLLFIFRQLTIEENVSNLSEIPLWLLNAIKKYNSPEYFKEGVQAFVKLCDRNTDYVNRITKVHLNKNTIDFINEIRMKYAANQLSMTDMPIKEIAINCGLNNIGYFYSLFKRYHHQTPYDYRLINQKIV